MSVLNNLNRTCTGCKRTLVMLSLVIISTSCSDNSPDSEGETSTQSGQGVSIATEKVVPARPGNQKPLSDPEPHSEPQPVSELKPTSEPEPAPQAKRLDLSLPEDESNYRDATQPLIDAKPKGNIFQTDSSDPASNIGFGGNLLLKKELDPGLVESVDGVQLKIEIKTK